MTQLAFEQFTQHHSRYIFVAKVYTVERRDATFAPVHYFCFRINCRPTCQNLRMELLNNGDIIINQKNETFRLVGYEQLNSFVESRCDVDTVEESEERDIDASSNVEGDEQSSSGNEPFIVPYADICESIGQTQVLFAHAWQTSLKAASDDYLHRVRVLWGKVFADLFTSSDRAEQQCRGLPLDRAISLYVSTLDESRSRDLLTTIKRIHSAASMNVEAFRKLVKKFDKGAIARGDDMLTSTLIPELYSAPLMAYPTLEGHIETLRDSLAVEDDSETEVDDDSIMHSIRRKTALVTKDSADVGRRADELSWLHDMLANIPSSEIPRLVAHRGELDVYGGHGFLEKS